MKKLPPHERLKGNGLCRKPSPEGKFGALGGGKSPLISGRMAFWATFYRVMKKKDSANPIFILEHYVKSNVL
jgi:hypothetical protein